jgi:transcriptional regulator with XRE-family HTH domain
MAKKRKRYVSLSDQIRRLMETSGETRYAIHKATGIEQSALSRFASGERGMSLENIDKVAKHLDLEVTTRREPKKGR